MEEYKLYELQCLKGKISSIIGRMIAAYLVGIIMGNVAHNSILSLLLPYIIVSWCWLFIKATRNWIVGIISSFVVFALFAEKISNTSGTIGDVLAFVLIFGLVIIDCVNVIRYFSLKASIVKEGIKIRRLSRDEMRSCRNSLNS